MTNTFELARIIAKKTFFKIFFTFYFLLIIFMAVPKKRTSKSKKNIRKAIWKKKASLKAQQALSLAKSIIKKFEEI